MNEGSRSAAHAPSWLPWAAFGLLVLPFHPFWVDFEQVRRGLLLVLAGAALCAWPRLPHVRGQRLANVFVLSLCLCALVQVVLQWWFHDPVMLSSFQPWDAGYRLAHWFALVVFVRLGAASGPQQAALPIATMLLVTSAFGLLQRLGLGEVSGYGVEREPVSTLGNLNVASEWTAIAATAVATLLPTMTGTWRRPLMWLALALACAYLVVNQSRSGLVALPIALLLLTALRRRQRLSWLPLAIAAAGGLIGLVVASAVARPAAIDGIAMKQELERGTVTLAVRLEIAKGATQLFAESPIYGQGPGQFAVQYPRVRSQAEIEASSFGRQFATEVRNAHDDWLELLVDGGLPALLLFAATLLALQSGARDKTRLLPMLALLLLMLIRSPIGNAPAAAVAFWLLGTPAEAVPAHALPPWRRIAAIVLPVLIGMAMLVLGLLPVVGNCVFVPYLRAARLAEVRPPVQAATAAAWWMPYEPRWLQIEGQENLADGNLQRAAHLAARAVKLRPFEPQYQLLLGEVLARSSRFEEALAVATGALQHDQENPQLRLLQSTVLAQLGRADEAILCVVKSPHKALRASLANHFGDLAELCATRKDVRSALRLWAEHHFVAAIDLLGVDEIAARELVNEHIGELAKALRESELIARDPRHLVLGALQQLAAGKPDVAVELGDFADKKAMRLLPWQRELLGDKLEPLLVIESWREVLGG